EAMPEDIAWSLPHVRRLLEAFHITGLTCDGYEADDIIGTLVRGAEPQGFECYMVTPDKDFAQLVSEKTFIYKPGRMGDAAELLALPEVRKKWGVERPEQVIDIIGLWGDASDNIPGVPGIGEKTASKLIAQYGSVENLLARTGELKGKLRENLEKRAGIRPGDLGDATGSPSQSKNHGRRRPRLSKCDNGFGSRGTYPYVAPAQLCFHCGPLRR